MSISVSDYISRLLRSITSYYSATYSTDTDAYAIVNTYATEFASGSAQLDQVHNNAFISTAESSALYPNFGTFVNVQKYLDQDYTKDTYYSGSAELTVLSDAFSASSTATQYYISGAIDSITDASGLDPADYTGTDPVSKSLATSSISGIVKFQNKIVMSYMGAWPYPSDWGYLADTGRTGAYKLFLTDYKNLNSEPVTTPLYATETLYDMKYFSNRLPADILSRSILRAYNVFYPQILGMAVHQPYLGKGVYGDETLYFLECYYDLTVPYTELGGYATAGPNLKIRLSSISSAEATAERTTLGVVAQFNYPDYGWAELNQPLQGTIGSIKPVVYQDKIYFFVSMSKALDPITGANMNVSTNREELYRIVYDPLADEITVENTGLHSQLLSYDSSYQGARYTSAAAYNGLIYVFGQYKSSTNSKWLPFSFTMTAAGDYTYSAGLPVSAPTLVGGAEIDTYYAAPTVVGDTLYLLVGNTTSYSAKIVSTVASPTGNATAYVTEKSYEARVNPTLMVSHRNTLYVGNPYNATWDILDPLSSEWVTQSYLPLSLRNFTGTVSITNAISTDDNIFLSFVLNQLRAVIIGAPDPTTYQDIRQKAFWASMLWYTPGHRVATTPYDYSPVPITYTVTGNTSLPSYRKQLQFMFDGAMRGSTHLGVQRTAQAFTGVTPDIIEIYESPKWTLTSGSGALTQLTPRTFRFASNKGFSAGKFTGAHLTVWGATKNPTAGHVVLDNNYNTLLSGPIYDRNLGYRFIGVNLPVSGSIYLDNTVDNYEKLDLYSKIVYGTDNQGSSI